MLCHIGRTGVGELINWSDLGGYGGEIDGSGWRLGDGLGADRSLLNVSRTEEVLGEGDWSLCGSEI